MQILPLHAEIIYRDGQYLLVNHAGKQTMVNGHIPLQQVTPLTHGDQLQFGSTRAVFMV